MTALRLRLRIESMNDQFRDNVPLLKAIGEVQESATSIDRDIGFLSWELRPTELETFGLVDALSSFVREWSKQHGIPAEFHAYTASFDYKGDRLPEPIETNLYRITQKALSNVKKHSSARNVSVLLHMKQIITLIIEDDGTGFDHEREVLDRSTSGGLISMQERAALLKGDLEIDSGQTGTTIMARIPLTES